MSKYEKPYENRSPLLAPRNLPAGIALCLRVATVQGYQPCPLHGIFDCSYPSSVYRRARVQGGGSLVPALTSAGIDFLLIFDSLQEYTYHND